MDHILSTIDDSFTGVDENGSENIRTKINNHGSDDDDDAEGTGGNNTGTAVPRLLRLNLPSSFGSFRTFAD